MEAVAADMGPAYIKAVRENFPEAALVFRLLPYHQALQRKTNRTASCNRKRGRHLGKKVLEGTRWLLMKTSFRLVLEKDEHTRLQEALQFNQPLATAYYMGVEMLKRFANTLAAFRPGIFAYYDFDRISTGPLEGANNKIKTLQKMAYGFRDLEFLELKIKGLHETKYALVERTEKISIL
uniref:Transposase n=1 Tax=Candidatus Kentrum sp. TC TaxID=2126339 RepID=A0A450YTX4_9GAMM|nr:MAG: Transposase [Candidatus Kentron sp. TC]